MTDAEDSELAGNSNRDSVPVRPQRGMDDPPDAKGNASPEDRRKPQSDADTRGDASKSGDYPFLLAQISAHLQENHLHLPIVAPDQEQLANIKENSPELYEIYLDSIRKAVDADYIQRTYPYTEPIKTVQSGRRYGLAAVLSVLAVATIALVLGHPGFATAIIAIDVVALAAVFSSGRDRGTPNE
ncbi:hypothetical protein [Corynebacterium propinquum]|uniref:hypothetical protein n=1 Tax=Corynebacterium propinquum TaxID=43769 RepID=UPI001EF24D9E|nr:hypothetical protein [Corynebacterium propinquum]MCG7232031.1 hypothetical protein [Corynebacterium propinquum]MDK4234255.1 hypothetical protein [Corynebacterium propinquum]MDK8534958.1 hypothetical protein [Corynebacterium propinquum]MDK8666631.1 hypothetical protein [Corynebacterium propinquum]WKS45461.1 hypothetical protein NLL36_02670 [Corynebacterium propinquum]